MSETKVPKNQNGSYTIYNVGGAIVTLTLPASENANFEVVTKDVPSGLPPGYTWLFNFGIKNPAGNFLPSVSYNLAVTDPDNRSWYIYYDDQVKGLRGSHTSPGDPPVGTG